MHAIKTSPTWGVLLTLVIMTFPGRALAQQQQDDMRRLLEQRNQAQSDAREREIMKEETDKARPTMVVEGHEYTVAHNANDVGRALYIALQNKQWSAAQSLLDEYLTLANRDPLLVHYAQGAIARLHGDYARAQAEYAALLDLKADFLPGRLELARVFFEDQQNAEARALFDAIEQSIDRSDPKTVGVLGSIDNFQQALVERDRWQGTAALGPAWSDNVNRTSASSNCLISLDGQCYFNRSTPDAAKSFGFEYDAAIEKRWSMKGHHGVYARTTLFGQGYRDNSQFNEVTAVMQSGYSFKSGRNAFVLAPSFEYYGLGNHTLYGAPGLHAEWSWTMSPTSLIKLEGDWKRLGYRRQDYGTYLDGEITSVFANVFKSFGERWMGFAGIDAVKSQTEEEADGFFQRGVRLGGSLQWPKGVQMTLFASSRWRSYGAYSAVLEARRRDHEQGYTLILRAQHLSWAGFSPVLTFRRNQVKSNIDWLYSYDRDAVSLKFEHAL